ncbi:MAG: hypothetical protein H6858_04820 [Rhodospirillales bacterium]|nr:hypothetical protein [Alphaproteobacteria bacterium]MCB9976907.1 hypothetical protein [Rhodospirillales bacterium]
MTKTVVKKTPRKILESAFPTKEIWEVSLPVSGVIWFKMGEKIPVGNSNDRTIGEYALIAGAHDWASNSKYTWSLSKDGKAFLDSHCDAKKQSTVSVLRNLIGLYISSMEINKKCVIFHLSNDIDFVVDAVMPDSDREIDFSFHFEQHGMTPIRYNSSGFYFYN